MQGLALRIFTKATLTNNQKYAHLCTEREDPSACAGRGASLLGEGATNVYACSPFPDPPYHFSSLSSLCFLGSSSHQNLWETHGFPKVYTSRKHARRISHSFLHGKTAAQSVPRTLSRPLPLSRFGSPYLRRVTLLLAVVSPCFLGSSSHQNFFEKFAESLQTRFK